MSHHIVCFMLGGPGSGKSTLSKQMVEEMGFIHISLGKIICGYVHDNPNEPDAIMFKEYIQAGKCIPTDNAIEVIMKHTQEMYKDIDECLKVLIDGFPRALEQLELFNKRSPMSFDNTNPNMYIIHLDTPKELMKERIYGRHRNDIDRDENVTDSRIEYFYSETMQVIDKISEEIPKQIITINGTDEIEDKIKLLKSLLG